MKTPKIKLLWITLIAVGLYVGIRAIPSVECAFLHVDDVVVDANGVEFCAQDVPLFLDIERLRFPVEMAVTPLGPLVAGEPVNCIIRVKTSSGTVFHPHELAITHTERLHLLLVDTSLGDYQHIHPEPVGAGGEWQFTFTPRYGGEYRLYAEFAPLRTRRKVVASQTLQVNGEPAPVVRADTTVARIGGYRFDLVWPEGNPRARRATDMRMQVSRVLDGEEKSGDPVRLQPIMGAYGHVAAFDAAGRGFAHLHPYPTGLEQETAPTLAFRFVANQPGFHKVWAQVMLDGQEYFIPFGVEISGGG